MAPHLPNSSCSVKMEEPEVAFAQKLAGNEKSDRDKALKKLKHWIELKSAPHLKSAAFSEVEMLKLWKGLFFCMWMSDKPLIQEELAEQLSQLVHKFGHPEDAITFCRTAFATLAREWNAIDAIRRDKFMMLGRRLLRQTLSLADEAGWSDDVTAPVLEVVRGAFARPEDKSQLPLGLQMHLIDIYLEELAKVGRNSLTEQLTEMFVQPFLEVLTVTRDGTLRSAIVDGVFHHLIRQSDLGIDHQEQRNGGMTPAETDLDGKDAADDDQELSGDDEADTGPLDPRAGGVDVALPQLPFSAAGLAQRLLEAGAEQRVRQANRRVLYRLAQRFRDLDSGVYPLALKLPSQMDSDSEISGEDMDAAVERLKSAQDNRRVDSRKRTRIRLGVESKRRRKNMLSSVLDVTGDATDLSTQTSDSGTVVRRHKVRGGRQRQTQEVRRAGKKAQKGAAKITGKLAEGAGKKKKKKKGRGAS